MTNKQTNKQTLKAYRVDLLYLFLFASLMLTGCSKDKVSFEQNEAVTSNKALVVDEPIVEFAQGQDFTSFTIPAGTYNLDLSMGNYGGYAIPLLVD